MGKDNRARRAAKARAKAKTSSKGRPGGRPGTPFSGPRAGAGPQDRSGSTWSPPPPGAPLFTEREQTRHQIVVAALAKVNGDPSLDEARRALSAVPFGMVCAQAERVLTDHIETLWANGWQPAEVHRQGPRGTTAAGGRLVALALATDDSGRRASTLDARWRDQVNALALPAVDGRAGWLRRWSNDEGMDRPAAIAALVDVIADLFGLPPLDPILPPPGSDSRSARSAPEAAEGAASDPVLERIRGLLAKAESTTFEAEATSLTAKAQELMTRHAIDAALVDARPGAESDAPVMVRLPIDAPYADAKSLLLQIVAEATRCRSVFHSRPALSTVIGFAADVAAAEMVFTSLLVQAQAAMAEAAKRAPAGTRTRSQSYRSAFLLSYTQRIDARLEEINRAVYAEVEAEQGAAFLPVLRNRADAVQDFMTERFGDLTSSRVRGGYDAAGWAGGRLAADKAQLSFGDLPDEAATG